MSDVGAPGSREALDLGCTCAVLDNAHGRGYLGQPGVFSVSCACPLHGTVARQRREEADNA